MQHVPELCVHSEARRCTVHGTWLAIEQLLQIVFPWASDGNEDDFIGRNDGPPRVLWSVLTLEVVLVHVSWEFNARRGRTVEFTPFLRVKQACRSRMLASRTSRRAASNLELGEARSAIFIFTPPLEPRPVVPLHRGVGALIRTSSTNNLPAEPAVVTPYPDVEFRLAKCADLDVLVTKPPRGAAWVRWRLLRGHQLVVKVGVQGGLLQQKRSARSGPDVNPQGRTSKLWNFDLVSGVECEGPRDIEEGDGD